MPYFERHGIDLSGTLHSGTSFARSQEDLEQQLLEQGIGLMQARRPRRLTYKPLSQNRKIEFFKECAELIAAGVPLPKALRILADQARHAQFQEILSDVTHDVHEGASLSEALCSYPQVFNELMISMVQAGQESGSLADALHKLADYLESTFGLRKKIRSAILLPLITFVVFVAITLVIFVVIMPSFAHILQSTGKPLSLTVQRLFAVSNFLQTSKALWTAGALVISGIATKAFLKTALGKPIADWLMLHVPFIGSILKDRSVTYYLQTVSVLLNGGVHLVPALQVATQTVTNSILNKQYQAVFTAVQEGHALSEAMSSYKNLFGRDMIALVRVGEEAGNLGRMLGRAADVLHTKVLRNIRIIATVVQPVLLLILGLLITVLIFVVYVPIFNLSDIVTM